MDSVTSAKTNETSTTATSEDYITAPEVLQKSTTEEDDEEGEEVEKVEHYLESPAKEMDSVDHAKAEVIDAKPADDATGYATADATKIVKMQLQSNLEGQTGLDDKEQIIKSPTHSFASSSSGSYSVHNTENGKKVSPPKEKTPVTSSNGRSTSEKISCSESKETSPFIAKTSPEEPIESEIAEKASQIRLSEADIVTQTEENIEVTRRKQELKLDLDVNAPPLMLHNLPTSATSDESSENSMIWQRIPLGSGDVKRKRQAFEQQIKAKSVDEKQTSNGQNQPQQNVPVISNKVARKIIDEEVGGSNSGSPGLARSPAMHQGFR